MDALIVFESMFGNAEAIAQAVAEGLAPHVRVDVIEVGMASAALPDTLDLLVVGGPTHTLTLSRPSTRADAARRAGHALRSPDRGLREWLDTLEGGSPHVAVGVFATRLARPWWLRLLPSAGAAIAKRLRRRGFRLLVPVESFYVAGDRGPLLPDEINRAHRWGDRLGTTLTAGGTGVAPRR